MQIIREIADIEISDLLIIAIDIEHGRPDPLRLEVGVAVLDTSNLHTNKKKEAHLDAKLLYWGTTLPERCQQKVQIWE